MTVIIDIKPFHELTLEELYSILTLRNEVFVVEQKSIYQDADGRDPCAMHVLATRGKILAGCARILPPATKYDEPSLGRLAVAPAARKTGLGKKLMQVTLDHMRSAYGAVPIRIEAQTYLKRFYEAYGFKQAGNPYDLTGIEHIEMLWAP